MRKNDNWDVTSAMLFLWFEFETPQKEVKMWMTTLFRKQIERLEDEGPCQVFRYVVENESFCMRDQDFFNNL